MKEGSLPICYFRVDVAGLFHFALCQYLLVHVRRKAREIHVLRAGSGSSNVGPRCDHLPAGWVLDSIKAPLFSRIFRRPGNRGSRTVAIKPVTYVFVGSLPALI